ncbi:hypothetical protein [Clostridium sp. AF36-4]|uniref:hypothetical protein n=1 Tax=Clostridium sp. AF36-4 TaxID=2293015 RepID=UPI000E3F2094|nr:hypothetical protein [Clostridium sp. AF36-4]RGF57270.1 hypothetical protein DW005_02345 [Clostridium sp. AF36-4]
MNKKTRKYVALSLLVALFVCTIYNSNVSKAEKTTYTKKAIICTVNNVSRTLTWSNDGGIYFKNGDSKSIRLIADSSPFLSIKFDAYGTCWAYKKELSDEDENKYEYVLRWWNYDILPDLYLFKVIPKITSEGYYEYVKDIESLILDSDNNFIIGYKTFSGKEYAIPTPEDMKKILSTDNYLEYPQPRPLKDNTSATPTPTVPATTPPAPTVSPVATPQTTSTPAVTPKTTVTPKVSVKKKAGYNCLSLGSKITSKYKLTKGKLTWKGNSKSKKYSGIKSAAFIKKSGNLVFLTKKGKAYTLSPKGKKKCIVKKKAKKLILKNKFAVKVQVGKKFINLANK